MASQILDVAAAAGEPAISIAKSLPGATIISTDLAPAFLDIGRARAAAAGVSEKITFEAADAENLAAYADASFDLVTCCMGRLFQVNLGKLECGAQYYGRSVGNVARSRFGPPLSHTFALFA